MKLVYSLKLGWEDINTLYNAVMNAYIDVSYDDPDNDDEALSLLSARFALEGAESSVTGRTFGDVLMGENDE